MPRGCWYDITVLNVHAIPEDKSRYEKDNFCEEVDEVFMTLMEKWGAKIFLKPEIRSEDLHDNSKGNDVRVVSFST